VENALFDVNRYEHRGVRQQHLGASEEQIAFVVQRIVEPGEDSSLRLSREVHERVATDQEIET